MAAACALALSGCSSDSGDQAKKQPTQSATSSSTQPTTTPSPNGTAPTTPSSTPTPSGTASSQGVAGVWLAMHGATKVQLVLGKGKAALTTTSLCGGGYTDNDGVGITLTCMDGNKDRTVGHGVLASDGKTLTVEWNGGITDTFTRTGLPSS